MHRSSLFVACNHCAQVQKVTFLWPYMSTQEAIFTHKLTISHTHTQKSWGWSFVMWGGIFRHAPYAVGSDLRHSSGNLCPNSCGPIRLCVQREENAIPGIMREIQSIIHLQSTPSVHICTCKLVSMSLCTPLSKCNSERVVCLQLPPPVCECVYVIVFMCMWTSAKGSRDGYAFNSLMVGLFSWGFVRRKARFKVENPDFTWQPHGCFSLRKSCGGKDWATVINDLLNSNCLNTDRTKKKRL